MVARTATLAQAFRKWICTPSRPCGEEFRKRTRTFSPGRRAQTPSVWSCAHGRLCFPRRFSMSEPVFRGLPRDAVVSDVGSRGAGRGSGGARGVSVADSPYMAAPVFRGLPRDAVVSDVGSRGAGVLRSPGAPAVDARGMPRDAVPFGDTRVTRGMAARVESDEHRLGLVGGVVGYGVADDTSVPRRESMPLSAAARKIAGGIQYAGERSVPGAVPIASATNDVSMAEPPREGIARADSNASACASLSLSARVTQWLPRSVIQAVAGVAIADSGASALYACVRSRSVLIFPRVAPPELPRGAFSLNGYSTLVFTGAVAPCALLEIVNEAVRTSGADTAADPSRCRLRACAWAAAAGTGAADCVHFTVRLFTDSLAAPVTHLAEFQRRSGDAFTFWRVLRRTLDKLRETSTGKYAVAPMSPWGSDTMRRDESCEPLGACDSAMALGAADILPIVEMVRAEFEDMRAEGCKMAASVAAAVRDSEAGMTACVDTELVAACGDVLSGRCGVESRTAVVTAFAEWFSSPTGRRVLRACYGDMAQTCALLDTAASSAPDYTGQQVRTHVALSFACGHLHI